MIAQYGYQMVHLTSLSTRTLVAQNLGTNSERKCNHLIRIVLKFISHIKNLYQILSNVLQKNLYFLVRRIKVTENGFTRYENETYILTENDFNEVKGFVPIKEKKLKNHMKNGRFGEWFGWINTFTKQIEEAKMKQKQEFREKRLKELFD